MQIVVNIGVECKWLESVQVGYRVNIASAPTGLVI